MKKHLKHILPVIMITASFFVVIDFGQTWDGGHIDLKLKTNDLHFGG